MVMAAIHAGLIFGLSLVVGLYPGFAKAGEVKDMRVQIAETAIFNMKEAHCKALPSNLPAATLYLRQLNGQIELYRALTGRQPQVPTCLDFGVQQARSAP